MSFEVFDRPRYGRGGFGGEENPYVKILKNGDGLYLSTTANALLAGSTHAKFLFDQEKRLAALVPCSPDDPNGNKMSRGRQIGARSFIRHYRIRPGSVCRAWRDGEMIIFDVGEEAA